VAKIALEGDPPRLPVAAPIYLLFGQFGLADTKQLWVSRYLLLYYYYRPQASSIYVADKQSSTKKILQTKKANYCCNVWSLSAIWKLASNEQSHNTNYASSISARLPHLLCYVTDRNYILLDTANTVANLLAETDL